MAFNKADEYFGYLCRYRKLNEAEKLLQKGEVSSEQVYNQSVYRLQDMRYLEKNSAEENAAFASSCLKYLQEKRPDDPYTKALQGVLYVNDKKYEEALELFKSGDISLDAFNHIIDIVEESEDEAGQLFLVNCLDYIDFSSLEENYFLPLSRSDIEYLLKLAQQHDKKDFIKSCLASKNGDIDKSDVLFTLKEDKNFSTYLSEALSQGYLSIDDVASYIDHILFRILSSENKEKYLKEFFSVLEKSSPEKFPSLFYECCIDNFYNSIRNSDDIKLLVESISSEQLARAIHYARGLNNKHLEEELMKYLTDEKQLQALSEITGIPQTENDALNEILTQLSLGKDKNDKIHFCECISELKTFKEEERQFFIAVLRGEQEKAIELFNPEKIDINKTLGGKTALMYAIDNGCNKLVEFLLAQEGLNPLIMDRNERIARDYERAKELEEKNQQTLETLTVEGKDPANLLFAAVEEHNVEKVVRLSKNAAVNLNIKDKEGKPLIVRALELAMAKEDFEIVQVLIEAGVDLNLEGDQSISGYSFLDANVEKIVSLEGGIEFLKSIPNYSPLIPLLTQGRYNADLIEDMLAEGVDINTVCARKKDGKLTLTTALETAISMQPDGRYLDDFERQDFTIAQDLLYMHERDENNVPIIKNPASVLYLAVKKSSVGLNWAMTYAIEPSKILTTLLCNGVDIDAVDENGDTALKKAVLANDFEGVYFLLKYGANPNHPSLEGIEWPGHAQGALNEHNMADKFLSDIKVDKEDTVVRRSPAQKKERFKDGKVNQTYEGYTPLMWAIKYERIDMIKLLLELNPDLSVVSETGKTALDIAAECKNPYIYFLLDKYAQQDSRTQGLRGVVSQESENLQELFLAIREYDIKRVKELTDQMSDLNIQDSKGNSPAKLTAELLAAMAVGEGKDYTVVNMMKLGAILRHLQSKGAKMVYSSDDSPIMILCQNLPNTRPCKTEQDVKKLLEFELIISELMDGHRGDLNCQDSKGNTPLHYAVMGSAPVVVSTILNQKVTTRDPYGRVITCYNSADIKNGAGDTARDFSAQLVFNCKYPDAYGMGFAYRAMRAFNSHPREDGPGYEVWHRSFNQTPEIRVVSDKPYERIEEEAKGDIDFEWVFNNEDKNQINHRTNQVFELLSELVSIRKGQEPQQASTTFDLRLIEAMEDEETTAETLRELIDERAAVNADVNAAVNAVVNAADGEGNTPLHHAVMYGVPEFVDVLIENNAEVNKTNAVGLTPLDLVIQNLNKQAALNEEKRDAEYVEALKEIAKRLRAAGGKAKKENLSEEAQKLGGVREIFGDTYQFKNEKQIKKEIVKLFRGKNSSINIRAVDPKDKKPMIIKVIETGDMDLITNILTAYRVTAEALLERGPDGRNAIDIAFASENKALKDWMYGKLNDAGVVLFDYKETCKALESVRKGILSPVKNARKNGIKLDLKVTDKEGKTILHHLAEQGHVDLLEQELSQWVYSNITELLEQTDNNGKTILHHLAEQGHVDLLEQALQQQLDSNNLSVLTITDKNGKTPLDLIPEDKKKDFVLKYLKEELGKEEQNKSVITELLEQLDEKTLEELKGNEEYQAVRGFIQDQLAGISQERAKVRALNQQGTNAVVVLNDNAERNITTARGTDGVDISYTAQRGRA